jgi:predicted RNA binding protein YcfA (HicA-like mRNA interferase family)
MSAKLRSLLGNLRVLSGSQLRVLLEAHGFVQVRQKGSHIVMQLSTADGSITVPVPDHREIRIGTLMSIIRQSGISKSVFETK